MNYFITERRDYARINKLEQLTDTATFWRDVRKLCRNSTSDHALRRWQILAEIRYAILTNTITKYMEA